MKFQKIFFFFYISAALVMFSNCTDPDIVEKAEDELFTKTGSIISATDVVSGFFDLGDIPNAYYSSTLVADGADVTGSQVFLSYNGGDETEIESFTSYPVELSLTLQEAVDAVGISIDDVAVGDVFGLRFVSTSSDGTYATGKRVNISATCSSALAGEYAYSTSEYFCAGDAITGTATITEDSPGVYNIDDWGFGTYPACYGGEATSWGTLQLTDVCNTLSIIGLDNYSDTWALSNLEVDGASLTFVWSNTYGETGKTTLTNPNGDWPPLKL